MPKTTESINTELHDFLTSRGFEPHAYFSNGKSAPTPEEADLFQFHFHKNGVDYGTVTVTVDGNNTLTVYANDDVSDTRGNNSDINSDDGETPWLDFVKNLKRFASQQHQLDFEIQNLDRLDSHMKQREARKKLDEGYYGTRNTSYTDKQPETVRIIIKHNKQLDENDQRFRHIDRIFLETGDGGRWPLPTRKPSQARAFARHLAEGGHYNDARWQHMAQLCEDINALGGFVRATRGGGYAEGVQHMISEAAEQCNNMRNTLQQLQTSRGYNRYFESWQPTLMECGDDTAWSAYEPDYRSAFQPSGMDPRIERALPVLGRLKITIVKMPEVDQFSSWADGITDGMIDLGGDAMPHDDMQSDMLEPACDGEAAAYALEEDLEPTTDRQVDELAALLAGDEELPVGPDAMNIMNQLDDLIDNDAGLNKQLRKAAKADPDNDAKPVIISYLQQHRQDEFYDRVLNRMEEGDFKKQPEPEEEPEEPAPAPGPDAGGLPPLPDLPAPPGGAAGAPTGLPPLQESDALRRILKLSGVK